jgi:hypothetical protein
MKKVKQIFAIIAIVLLVGLYLSTLIFAIIGSKDTMVLFKTAIFSTIVIPVLIWAYTMIFRLLKDHFSFRDDKTGKPNEKSQDTLS